MGRPRPLEPGDLDHLTWGSIRWSIARQMRLAADMAAQAGGDTSQYAALLGRANVVLTADQLRGFLPREKWPAALGDHPLWLLTGGDTLRPHRRP